MMQKLLADGAGYILVLVGIVVSITVGVMSILLPFLVFKIMTDVSAINKKLAKVVTLLSESGQEERGGGYQSRPEKNRLGPVSSVRDSDSGSGERPLRFQ